MLLRLLKKEKQNLQANNLIIENFSEPHLDEVFSIESTANPTPWKIDTFKQVLEVRESNKVAINFYKKLNFKEVGHREGYYKKDSGRESALLMSLALS